MTQAQSDIALRAATTKADKAEQSAMAAKQHVSELTEQLRCAALQVETVLVVESEECEIATRYKSEAHMWESAVDEEPL